MRISDSLVEQLLRDAQKVTEDQLVSLREQEKTEKKPLQDIVVRNGVINEKDLTKLYSEAIDIPYIEPADWHETVGINYTAAFLWSRPIARHMIETGRGGDLLFVSSMAGLVDVPGYWPGRPLMTTRSEAAGSPSSSSRVTQMAG